MSLRIRDQRSLGAGLLFLAIGGFASWTASGYAFGSARHMGPGYFPMVLSIVLMLIGVGAMLRSLSVEGPPIGRIALRPALCITTGVLVFSAVVDRWGLVPAVIALTLIVGLGSTRVRLLELVAIAVVLAMLAVAIFIHGLQLPFTPFGRG
jgi:hypothetical protein